ncbi:hypothetical protein JHK85_046609 [Glycine max]|nr:hypothetical protein JHK85_046609 [Glycine max]
MLEAKKISCVTTQHPVIPFTAPTVVLSSITIRSSPSARRESTNPNLGCHRRLSLQVHTQETRLSLFLVRALSVRFFTGGSVIDKSFGFDTAVEEAQGAINFAHVEAESTENGIDIVKLMGRYSVQYKFILFGDGDKNPSYCDLVNMITSDVFDAAVGDIAIVSV